VQYEPKKMLNPTQYWSLEGAFYLTHNNTTLSPNHLMTHLANTEHP